MNSVLTSSLLMFLPTTLMQPNSEPALDTSYLRAHAQTRGFMLGRPTHAMPTPDGKSVLFLRSEPRVARNSLFEFDLASGKTRELLTPQKLLKGAEEKLSPEEKARRERMRVSVGGFTGYQLSGNGNLVLLSFSDRLYIFDRTAGTSQELKTGPGELIDPQFSPDGTRVAYVLDHDVYVLDLATHKENRLTTGGTALLSHGLAEFVAQEEMGRFSGFWWSPDSKKIAFQETDAKGVEVWYVADPIYPDRPPTPFFYPRPGRANVKVRLGVVPSGGGDPKWITWSIQYPYLASVHWNGPLLLTVQSRDQTKIQVLAVDEDLGGARPTTTAYDPAWLNLHQDYPQWTEARKGYLWLNERPTGPILSLFRTRTSGATALVQYEYFRSLVHVDPSGKAIIFSGGPDPTQLHLFRTELADGGKPFQPKQLTSGKGQFGAVFSSDGGMYVLTARLLGAMPKTTVHDGEGKLLGELPSVAEEPPFEPRVELVEVGKEPAFHAAIVWPRKFDAKKRYPVLVDVYGGPHHQHVRADQSRWLLDQWYADQGFIVAAIDGRGTPARGRDWERAIKYKFGSLPLDDQVAGLQALGRRFPAMDLKRVGIDGWSFGGYMAGLAVLRRPDVFHVGVAGAPVVDWLDYDTHYTERYLGVPTLNPKGKVLDPAAAAAYKEASLLTYAADLKRPLLLLHGTADDNVYFRHSLRLADALFRAGKDFEILPLSGLTHMVPDPVVMENLHGRIARFLQKHLGRPE